MAGHDVSSDPWRLSLRQMSIFCAVAESGSLRAASRLVHLTQPAVTHAVREMEQSLGVPLFVRSAKGATLTEAGATLLRRSRLVFNELRRTQEEIRQLRDGTTGSLSVAFSAAAARLLPQALLDFRARRPGVSLDFHELTWPHLDPRWQSGSFDFAVISEYGPEPNDGLTREQLREVPLRVAMRDGHPLARMRSLRGLGQALWLVPSNGRPLLEQMFVQRGLPVPTDVVACQSMQLGRELMHLADALALMAVDVIEDRRMSHGMVSLDLPGPPLATVRISLLIREPASLTPAARVFIACLRRAAAASPEALRSQDRRVV